MQDRNKTTYLADWLLCLLLQHVMCLIACGYSHRLDMVRSWISLTVFKEVGKPCSSRSRL